MGHGRSSTPRARRLSWPLSSSVPPQLRPPGQLVGDRPRQGWERRSVHAHPTGNHRTALMFSLVSSLVIRHPRAIVLGWLVLTAGLHYLAPPWDRITKDDDLGLFPADSPSVIGQELLERGFPQDASSSDLVLIYERKNGRLTPGDFRFVDSGASSLFQFAREHPELGVDKIETYRSPVIGSRLISRSTAGLSQAVLSIVSLHS